MFVAFWGSCIIPVPVYLFGEFLSVVIIILFFTCVADKYLELSFFFLDNVLRGLNRLEIRHIKLDEFDIEIMLALQFRPITVTLTKSVSYLL